MTRSRTRKHTPMLRASLALWAGVLLVALAVLVLHVIGWLAATAAVAGATYMLGRRSGQARRGPAVRQRAPKTSARVQPVTPQAPEPATAILAPPDPAIRQEVTAGLVSLGWSARDVRPAIDAALSDPTVPRETPAVLRAILAAHAATLGGRA
jgi:RuvA, C-terminal domain